MSKRERKFVQADVFLDQLEVIDPIAKDVMGCSRAHIIRMALDLWIKEYKKKEKQEAV